MVSYLYMFYSRLFHLYTYFFLFYNALIGLAKAMRRIITSAMLNLFFLPRLDRPLVIKGFENLDKGMVNNVYSSNSSILMIMRFFQLHRLCSILVSSASGCSLH